MMDVSNLASGENRVVTLDFDRSIGDYTCKVFLWDKATLSPVCPTYIVNEIEIPGTGKVFFQNVKVVEGSGGKQLEVTVETENFTMPEKTSLMGVLYNSDSSCFETVVFDISGFASGDVSTVTLTFENIVTDYDCKIFLWDMSTLSPLCQSCDVNP